MGGTKNKYQKCGNVTELKQSLWLCRTNTITARQWESSQSQVPQKSFLCDHLQKFKLWGSSEILPGVMVLQKCSQPWEYRRQTMSSRVLSVDLRDFFYISLLEGQKCPMGDGRPPPRMNWRVTVRNVSTQIIVTELTHMHFLGKANILCCYPLCTFIL